MFFSCPIDADGVTTFYDLLRSLAGTVYHAGIAHMPFHITTTLSSC